MYLFSCGCGHIQAVDLGNLKRQKIDELHKGEGYNCELCGTWVTVFITTKSLDKAMEKLNKLRVTRPDFRYHFLKVLKKATAIQKKVAVYG